MQSAATAVAKGRLRREESWCRDITRCRPRCEVLLAPSRGDACPASPPISSEIQSIRVQGSLESSLRRQPVTGKT